jgi:FkbM family methyltransferase
MTVSVCVCLSFFNRSPMKNFYPMLLLMAIMYCAFVTYQQRNSPTVVMIKERPIELPKPNRLHPAFVFPQLYRCAAAALPMHSEYRSQSHEDLWLFENFFSGPNHTAPVRGGTFIEIGALDGETFSNTWYFEQRWDWRGILIEGHPANQPRLRATRRKNVAIFTTGICGDNPGVLSFTQGGGAVGGTDEFSDPAFLRAWHADESARVQSACVPLQLILDATGLLEIDLFSLDVEGAELAVLETIDWGVTNIHVIVVELDGHNPAKDQAVRSLLMLRGFVRHETGSIRDACVPGGDCTQNEVFVNPAFQRPQTPPLRFQMDTGMRCE